MSINHPQMKTQLTIKQILRKKYSNIKKNLLFKNKDLSNNYHWALRQSFECLVKKLLDEKRIKLKQDQLFIGTYLPIPQIEIIPPSLSLQFQEKHGIKTTYFTPYFKSEGREMHFINYDKSQSKSSQISIGPYGVKVPNFIYQSQIINPPNLNLLLVPLIAISETSLHRIGYGGGYYDEYIRYSKPQNTISVGIALEGLIFNQNQIENNQNMWSPWDQQLDFAISNERILQRGDDKLQKIQL